MHGILLGGPLTGCRIVVTKPTLLPHQTRLDGKFFRNVSPESDVRRQVFRWMFSSEQCHPTYEQCGSLGHTRLQVHRTDVLNDRATGLLRTEAAGDILAAFPRTGIHQPALGIAAMVQPPAHISCSRWVEAAQPIEIASTPEEL